MWNSSNLEGHVPIFVSPRNRMMQLYSRALGSIYIASYGSQGYGGDILTRLHSCCSLGNIIHVLYKSVTEWNSFEKCIKLWRFEFLVPSAGLCRQRIWFTDISDKRIVFIFRIYPHCIICVAESEDKWPTKNFGFRRIRGKKLQATCSYALKINSFISCETALKVCWTACRFTPRAGTLISLKL
jgi:hypothetical protein